MTPLPRTGRLLALDWGEIRIGLAASDETQLLASPLQLHGDLFPVYPGPPATVEVRRPGSETHALPPSVLIWTRA